MALLPNLIAAGPGAPLFAPAGAAAAIPANLIVSTLTAAGEIKTNPYLLDGDLVTQVSIRGNDTFGPSIYMSGGADGQPLIFMNHLSSISVPTTVDSSLQIGVTSTFATIATRFSDGAGGLAPAQTGILQNAEFTSVFQAESATEVLVGQGFVRLNTDVPDQVLINGAPVASFIFSTPMTNPTLPVGNSKKIGAFETVMLTSSFATDPGKVYRISWADEVAFPNGIPASTDFIRYNIADGFDLNYESLPLLSSMSGGLGGQNLQRFHSFEFTATLAEYSLEFQNVTNSVSTVITVSDTQPILVQRLGPWFGLVPPAAGSGAGRISSRAPPVQK